MLPAHQHRDTIRSALQLCTWWEGNATAPACFLGLALSPVSIPTQQLPGTLRAACRNLLAAFPTLQVCHRSRCISCWHSHWHAAPWKHSCPGCTDWVWKYFQNFLSGIVISHHLSKLSVLLQEFKAGQTNSVASSS